jgi:hypothetical protein
MPLFNIEHPTLVLGSSERRGTDGLHGVNFNGDQSEQEQGSRGQGEEESYL